MRLRVFWTREGLFVVGDREECGEFPVWAGD